MNFESPVYQVKAVEIERLRANAYNPNHTQPRELKLLYQSIKEDGYTQPVVCYELENGDYEIVDGFHRFLIMKTHKDIYEREGGKLPVVVIDKPLSERMASTIRHNRARGTHETSKMGEITNELLKNKGSDWIVKNLGMSAEEVLKLSNKQTLCNIFKDRDFSKSWEILIKNFQKM